MNPQSANSHTRLAIAIVLASVLVSATLYATVGQAERTTTSTSTSTTTDYATESGTTTSTVSSTITSTYFLTTTSFQTTTSATVSGQSLTPASFADPTNESFQFVQATVGQTGSSAIVNATFHSELMESGLVSVDAVAYPAETTNPYGLPGEVACCPLIQSYSQAIAGATSDTVEAGAHAQFSPSLALPSSLNGTYLVKLYVTSSNGTLLSPISSIFLQVQGGVAHGGQADAGSSFFDNDNDLLYVADSGIDAVTVINGSTSTVVATISLPDITGEMSFDLYDPSSSVLYVWDGVRILALNTTDNFIVGSLNEYVSSMAYDPATGLVYGFGSSYIFALNGPVNIASHIMGIHGATRGIYDTQRQQMLVTASNGTLFALLKTGSVAVGSISNSTSIFLYDPDNAMLYASNPTQAQGETITAISSSTLQPVGKPIEVSNSSSSFLFYDPFNKDLYFYSGPASFSSGGDLIAISTATDSIVATIPVPGLSAGLVLEQPSFVYDSINGDVYATELTNPHNGTVGLLDIGANSNTVVSQTFPPNMPLNYITLDAKDGRLYGAYGGGSSTIFSLILESGAVTTIEVGSVQAYTLLP